MRAILPLLVFVVTAQDALVITVLDTMFTTPFFGLESLDEMCSYSGGGVAMVCLADGSRRWDQYAGRPVYSGLSVPCGNFPAISAPITFPSGAALNGTEIIYTGCDITGAPFNDSAASCNNWTSMWASTKAVTGVAGATGTDWLSILPRKGCNASTPFVYCAKVIEPTIYVGTVPTVYPDDVLDSLDAACRVNFWEDDPFARALVCHPARTWPAALANVAFTDRETSLPLGYPFRDFNITNPISGTGNGTLIFTGCNNNLTYAGASQTCANFNLSDPFFFTSNAASSASNDTSLWLNDGVNRSCCLNFQVYCVRSELLYSSQAPTLAPTRRPTRAPTTKAPTTTAPSKTPTTSAPSRSPTTRAPAPKDTPPPTLAPSDAPTSQAPSSPPPTNAPTPQPTSVPVVIVLTNATGNATQNVTVPGNVTIILPNSLFLYGNSTSKIVIGRGNLSDFVSPGLLGGGSVVSVDVVVDGDVVDVSDLSVPIEFVMPRGASMCEAQRNAATRCMWRDVVTQTWRPDNCSTSPVTLSDGTPATLCKCNHLTDFAVLLDRETLCGTETADESFLVFAAIYVLIALYCFVVLVRLQLIHDQETLFLRIQHISIGAVAFVRMLSCLRYYDLLGDSLALEAVLTALPYLLEFWIFTRLVSTWLGLVKFTLLQSTLQWHKIRPWLFGVNILGSLFTIALFVAFLMQLDYTTALVGTIGIATVYMLLAVTFLYYSSQLVNTMAAPIKRSSATSDGNSPRKCTLGTRILLAGRASAFCFAMQAVSSVLALVLERELIMVFSALFMAFNCIALIGLLMLYYGAVQRGLQPQTSSTTGSSTMSRASGHVELVSMKSP